MYVQNPSLVTYTQICDQKMNKKKPNKWREKNVREYTMRWCRRQWRCRTYEKTTSSSSMFVWNSQIRFVLFRLFHFLLQFFFCIFQLNLLLLSFCCCYFFFHILFRVLRFTFNVQRRSQLIIRRRKLSDVYVVNENTEKECNGYLIRCFRKNRTYD